MVRALPDARAWYKDAVSPIYFTSSAGDAILCPLRLTEAILENRLREMYSAPVYTVADDKRPALGLRVFAALYSPAC